MAPHQFEIGNGTPMIDERCEAVTFTYLFVKLDEGWLE
jgi:hypothetical protein